jgi:hypothetical protein
MIGGFMEYSLSDPVATISNDRLQFLLQLGFINGGVLFFVICARDGTAAGGGEADIYPVDYGVLLFNALRNGSFGIGNIDADANGC